MYFCISILEMIHYLISYKKAYDHFIDFNLSLEVKSEKKILLQLASWRPGRYELANYAQNIQKWDAYDSYGKKLVFRKINKDLWEVKTVGVEKVIIKYRYYANQLDAGGSYLDKNQLYINPVNCCHYIVGRENEKYQIQLDIPKEYRLACSLKKLKKHTLLANSYDDLAESPLIASGTIQKKEYSVKGIRFYVWFQGPCKPDWKKIIKDFKLFTKSQIQHFGSFPKKEYHFLFQITPYKSYHGVEHSSNTVILLGPGNQLNNKRYEDLLGISSHELYHTWNIKAIRPIEMYPYDYTKENYFKTGFVAEGVTTYMGDLMLLNSGVFTWSEFIKTQNQNLERHLINYGRENMSVADSGFDSWLDGYKLGIPNRKISIYADAALCMLMIDLFIINNTNGMHSLHSVMKDMFLTFNRKGYTEKDFKNLCIKYGGAEVREVFSNQIYNTKSYIPKLKKALKIVGLDLEEKNNPNLTAQYFGFISVKEQDKIIIKMVEPDSIADKNEIAPLDEISLINRKKINKPLTDYLKKAKKDIIFTIKKKFSEKEITLKIGNYYKLLEFVKIKNTTEKQLLLRKKWSQ